MRILVATVCLFLFITGVCQEYSFTRLTEEDGLPGNHTHCFLKDDQGFMWIGTANGLCRYDGTEFVYFTQQQGYSISSDQINELLQDSNGIIWIGTNNGGLNAFDPKTNTFESFTHYPSDPNSIAADRIQTIVHGDENTLWMGFDNAGGFSKLDKKTKKITNYDPFEPLNLRGVKAIRDIVYDKKHNKLWLGTTNGLIAFDLLKEEFQLIEHQLNPLGLTGFFALEQIDENRLIAGFFGAGVDIYHIDEARWEGAFAVSDDPIRIYNMSQKSPTEFWVAARRKGLAIFDTETNRLEFVPSDIEKQKTPFPDFTYEVFGEENGVWVGSRQGASYSYLKTNTFLFNPLNFSVRGNDGVQAITGKYDKIYTAGTGTQIWEIDKVTGKKVAYAGPTNVLSIDGMFEIEGLIYFIGNRNQILIFDKKTKTISEIPFDWKAKNISITAIKPMQKDKAVIICRYGGSYTLDLKSHQIVQTHASISPDIWQHDALIQKDGSLWIATNESVTIYDSQKDSISFYFPKSISSKREKHIYSIAIDPLGNTWLGTGHGLVKVHDRKETLYNVLNSDLLDNYITDIAFDKDKNMWIKTRKGVSKINPTTMEMIHFDQSDGINNEGVLSTVDGEIFYGVSGGYYNLSERIENPVKTKPEVFLTDFYIAGDKAKFDSAINFSKEVHLEYWNNSFAFSFTSPHFVETNKIEYAYRLVGLSENWTHYQNRRFANYTNLDGGTYRFEVKAKSRDSQWSEIKSIVIHLKLPFWETWWFYTLCGLSAVGIGFTFHRIRIRTLQRKADLEAQELRTDALQKRLLDLNLNPFEKQLDIDKLNRALQEPLTDREFEVLDLTIQEKTNAEIADQLFISVRTVKFHLGNTYKKLGVSNRKEALAFVNKTS